MSDILIEETVIERIQNLMNFKHWSIYKLAKESELPYSSLNNIFTRRTCPSVATLEKICKGFNISLSEFFNYETNPLRVTTISEEHQKLINEYETLSANDKQLLQAYLRGLHKR